MKMKGYLLCFLLAAIIKFAVGFKLESTLGYINYSGNAATARSLLKGYDKRFAPSQIANIGMATVVSVAVQVQEIFAISDANLEYTITVFLNSYWTDQRLQFNGTGGSNASQLVFRSMSFLDLIWVPDLYFTNERVFSWFHNITTKNAAAWVRNDGYVAMTRKHTALLGCPMDLRTYPFDTQQCTLQIGSFSYDVSEMQLQWLKGDTPSVVLPTTLSLQAFQLQGYDVDSCKNQYVTGTYPCLTVAFALQRQLSILLITLYFPTAFVVVVSFVGFWIAPNAAPARATLCATTLLTTITQIFVSGLNLPKVPYIKAIDVWFLGCMMFVFCCGIEYAIVSVTLRAFLGVQTAKGILRPSPTEKLKADTTIKVLFQISRFLADIQFPLAKSFPKTVDFVARILFPLSYAVFVGVYFAYYLYF